MARGNSRRRRRYAWPPSGRRRRPGVPCDPGRDEQRRWQRQARETLAALEVRTDGEEKHRRLLISLAEFLEPAHSERLGVEGVWGVFRAFREIAGESAPR